MNATNDNQLPMPEPESDATAAFNRLADQVSTLETAVHGLVGKIDDIPDTTETLGVIAQHLQGLSKDVRALTEQPSMRLTPETMARDIAAAAETAWVADQAALSKAVELHAQAAQSLHQIIGNAHNKDDQTYLQRLWGLGGVVAGVLLGAILPGMIARTLPASWQLPERMAVSAMGEADMQAGGQRLLRAGNPQPGAPSLPPPQCGATTTRPSPSAKRPPSRPGSRSNARSASGHGRAAGDG